jgi:hypothetical protein
MRREYSFSREELIDILINKVKEETNSDEEVEVFCDYEGSTKYYCKLVISDKDA